MITRSLNSKKISRFDVVVLGAKNEKGIGGIMEMEISVWAGCAIVVHSLFFFAEFLQKYYNICSSCIHIHVVLPASFHSTTDSHPPIRHRDSWF